MPPIESEFMTRRIRRLIGGMSAGALLALAGCAKILGPGPEEPSPEESRRERPRGAIRNSADLIEEMHDRYAGKWYRTLKFEQANTFVTQSGGEQKSRWLQHLSVPGRLRIDFLPLSTKSGLLILNNRVTSFDNGRRVESRRSIQPILTLTGDVYAIPPAITLRRLDSLGVRLSRFHDERWERKRVYVIGAKKGDLESTQVWVDADKLVLVRFIQRDRRGDRSIITDTRIGKYREIDGYLVASEFTSYRDGKMFFREEYENVRVNEPIPSGVFDATRWTAAQPSA
jgi:hypothetical protein